MASKGKKDAVAEKNYSPGDLIIDNEMAPPAVKKDRAPKDKTSFLVQFFPTGDYAWTKARDISTLTDAEITKQLGSGKKGDLQKGYRIAQNPKEWNDAREDDEKSRLAAEEEAAEFDTEDQLASGDEGKNGDKSKKRKRKSDTGAAKEKPEDKKAKKAKLEKLAKSRTAGGAAKKSQPEDAAPPKKSRSAPVDDEEPGLRQVKDWRHKLQKVFLGKGVIAADELTKCKEYFDLMEKFVMTKEYLAESKLGKVLKRIAFLEEGQIPNGDEFGFRTRASALAHTWSVSLGEKGDATEGTPAPANGAVPDAEPAPPAEEVKPVEADAPVEPTEPVVVKSVEAAAPVEATAPAAPAEPTPPTEVAMDVEPKTNGDTAVNGESKDEPMAVDEVAPAAPAPVAA
ncbi:hypothetical protein RQP46_006809 [Phenoliferia psychrophenolica]